MKNKNLIIILLTTIFYFSIIATYSQIVFDKSYYFDNMTGYSRDLVQTDDGGYVVIGGFGASMFDERHTVFKVDSLGELQWYNYFGTQNSRSHAIDKISNEGFIVCGYTQNNPEWRRNPVLIRYNNAGDTIWYRQYLFDGITSGGTYSGDANFNDIIYTSDSCFLTVGSVGFNPLAVKTNLIGDTLWTWRLNELNNTILLNAVVETSQGNYIAAGYARMPIFSKSSYALTRGILVYLDRNGNLLDFIEWEDIDYTSFNDIAIDSNNNVYICGHYQRIPPEVPDIETFGLFVKIDATGNTVFYKKIIDEWQITSQTISITKNNKIVIGSQFVRHPSTNWGRDILLQKYDSSGNLLWTRSIGGKDYGFWIHGMIITSDGGIAFTGSGPDCEIGLCAWLVKTDSLGNGTYPVGYEFNNINEESNPINEISIYPNPANIELNIVLPYENINGKIEIFNITGQLMLRNDNCKNNCSFSVANLPEGIYLVKTQINSRVYINKIIIHH
jgi:hypothetical protein